MAKIPAGAVHGPGIAVLLVESDDQPVPFLAQVAFPFRVHHVGQFAAMIHNLLDGVGGQVLVLHGMERQVHPGHGAHFPGPQAGGVDHVFGNHAALVGHDLPSPVGSRVQCRHAVPENDLGAVVPGGPRIGMGRAGGVEVPVQRIVQPADDAVGVGDRRQFPDFRGADEMGVETHVPVLGPFGPEKVHPVRRARQGDSAHMVEPAALAGLLLQFTVQLDRVALQRGHVGVRIEGVETPGRMPGGPRGQLGALDEGDIGPAELCQMIQNAASDHAAADHGDPGMAFHFSGFS